MPESNNEEDNVPGSYNMDVDIANLLASEFEKANMSLGDFGSFIP